MQMLDAAIGVLIEESELLMEESDVDDVMYKALKNKF